MILIIDDDSAIRSSLSFMLKRAKYDVQAVPGPKEAIEIVRSVAPQLILMDMNFTLSTSGEEGLTLLKQVKVFRPDVPVILMTAWGSIQLAVQGMQAGAFDFITKPWNNVALMQRIETALELTSQEVAESCQLTVEEYLGMESGEKDISVSALQKIARKYGIALDVLMFGEEPKMSSYFLTRCGSGVSVERTKAYKYQSLASGFRGRKADPFIVTVEPKPENTPIHFNSHEGQEFNLVIEGRMLLNINGKELILNPGDSLYFDSSIPHGMMALDDKTVKFLAVIL
jgi:FixJ family two-component response regulator/quercetin dioxygenase-like cupin family protein